MLAKPTQSPRACWLTWSVLQTSWIVFVSCKWQPEDSHVIDLSQGLTWHLYIFNMSGSRLGIARRTDRVPASAPGFPALWFADLAVKLWVSLGQLYVSHLQWLALCRSIPAAWTESWIAARGLLQRFIVILIAPNPTASNIALVGESAYSGIRSYTWDKWAVY